MELGHKAKLSRIKETARLAPRRTPLPPTVPGSTQRALRARPWLRLASRGLAEALPPSEARCQVTRLPAFPSWRRPQGRERSARVRTGLGQAFWEDDDSIRGVIWRRAAVAGRLESAGGGHWWISQ